MRRRLLFILLGLTAGLLLLIATVPLWLGVAARIFAPERGLTFASYERVGYSRFALNGAEYQRQRVRVTASRIEIDTPVVFMVRRWMDRPNPITVGNWQVLVSEATGPAKPPNPDSGWTPLNRLLQRIAFHLNSWAPHVTTAAGVVRWPTGEVTAERAVWKARELTADGLRLYGLSADAALAFAESADALRLRARSSDETMNLNLASDGPAVKGEFVWLDQPARLDVMFGPRGWLPTDAVITAEQWTVPADRLKMGQLYETVQGAARVEWRDQKLAAEVDVSSRPLPGKSAPPLNVNFRGNGDREAFTIEALQANVPGVTALLSEPVTIQKNGVLRGAGARLTLAANLAEQPWFKGEGAIAGEAKVVSNPKAMPTVAFDFQGTEISAFEMSLSAFEGEGTLEWPRLQIARAAVTGLAGEQLTGRGGWDFNTKEFLDAQIEGTLRRVTLARWLPEQPVFDIVQVSAQAAGAPASLVHSGELRAGGVKFNALNPLALDLRWSGRGTSADMIEVEARAGASRLRAAGAIDRNSLRLIALEFKQTEQPWLQLAAPVVVRWTPTLQIQDLQLTGPQTHVTGSLTLGSSGRIQLAAGNISSAWFTDLLEQTLPTLQIRLLALSGVWDGGPMTFSLTAGASLDLGEGRTAAVNASARGDKDGLRIEALRATEGTDTVVNATGRLPVTVEPSSGEFLQIAEQGPVVFEATAAPNAAFWQKLAALSGVELEEPQAVANVKGTWSQPEGHVMLQAARLSIDPKRFARPLPALEQIDVSVAGDRRGVTLQRFAINVEGQPVKVSGLLPVPDGGWTDMLKNPLSMMGRTGDLQLEVPEAEVAVFARFLPAVLAPQGRIAASLNYKDGGIQGFVRLRDAASRPLGPLGVLQEITADLEMSGRKLLLRGVSARSGGQPVILSGTVELPEKGDPRFDLALKGENLPFVRQTGLLVRGDLDLKLQTPGTAAPRLSGTVRLRDSLFLSDVRSYLPRGGGSAVRRPPYFEVDTPPINTWGLAVELTGDRFMRLRTPVFNGVASARFRLSGTLGEPRAIGEVEIDEGIVRMPFARFEVQQGSVRLTEADPFEPTLYLRGTGRRYGYDLTLEIDGKASMPNVVFTSSPALDSEQVLLMVMTGAAPDNEITVTGAQRMTRLGTFLGQNLLNTFTSDSDADRLSITSGEKVSRGGKETYDVEYRISDRWTVRGEYNEFDEVNAGLKWRIFRGEGRPREADSPKEVAGAGK